MSSKLDEFEITMSNIRNFIVDKILSFVMNCAVWSVETMKHRTDNDTLLKIKTMSDKILAELAGEIMVRNKSEKHRQAKIYERP
jgi:hypothetical protein